MATNMSGAAPVVAWTNDTGSAVSEGDVVAMGHLLGVALMDIAINDVGSVSIDGVFIVPKISGAVIGFGQTMMWDVSAAAFDDHLAAPVPLSGDITGGGVVAIQSAGNGTTTVMARFTGVPGTVA